MAKQKKILNRHEREILNILIDRSKKYGFDADGLEMAGHGKESLNSLRRKGLIKYLKSYNSYKITSKGKRAFISQENRGFYY